MNEATRHKLVWGWLRVFLAWVQMSLAVAGFAALLTVGIHPLTWAFVVGATAATLVSRLLYQGRSAPRINRREPNE